MTTKDTVQTQAPSPDLAATDAAIQQAVAQLQGIYQILPDFVPAPADGVKGMRSARSFTDAFLEASAVAAENDTTMQAKTGLDPAETRLVINRNLRFGLLLPLPRRLLGTFAKHVPGALAGASCSRRCRCSASLKVTPVTVVQAHSSLMSGRCSRHLGEPVLAAR